MPTGISYKWETYPAFPKLSVIVLYIVRDSTLCFMCGFIVHLHYFHIFLHALYIFLGWCSPSMWPLVLYQNWLFIAKHFPFILFPELPCPKVVIKDE